MMNTKEIYLTEAGYDELKKELEYLKIEKRPEIIDALKEARSLGDLSENAEYDAARTEQGMLEAKIKELEVTLEHAIVVKNVKKDKVAIGNNVKLEYLEDGDIDVYSIVGNKEADPFSNKISNESPIAQAINGLSVGEVATVNSQNGKYNVKVIEIF
ncbi:MAG: transcription elongation factor GreA [Bacilli bacterium]|nr:transcription elongation factor GreA [Bacilli bacterium]MDD4282884.1 transcription elongation factor GreA [Bacilli bacterium]MDD4718736.1 transcription elongation factor GreA [Bacilli bacterium]